MHQLDSNIKLSKHTTHHPLIDVLHWCMVISLNDHSRFPKKTTASATKKHAANHQNPQEHDLRHGPFKIHGRPTRSDYKNFKKEASDLASKLEDITYDWSRSPSGDEYGLLAKIIGEDEYNHLTNLTWVQEVQPNTYDPNITDTTATHTRKRMEQEWERTR